MKGKQLLILAVVAIILVVAAIKSSTPKVDPNIDMIGNSVIADLDLNRVDTVMVEGATSTTTIERGEHGWTIREKHDYPADFEKVRANVIELAELKVADVIDLSPAEHARLGIGDPSAEVDAKKVTLKGGGNVLGALILGKEHTKQSAAAEGYGGYPDGRYLMRDGGDHVFRVAKALTSYSDKPIDWVDTDLLNVSRSDLEALVITGADREAIHLKRVGADLVLEDRGEDEEIETTALNALGNALSYLTLRDVADPELSDDAMGFTQPTDLEAKTKDGTRYSVQLGSASESDGRYVRIRVDFVAPPSPAIPDAAAHSNAVQNVADPDAELIAKHRTTAEALNQKLSPWTFVIAGHKGDAMLKSRDQLVKKKAPETADASEPMTPEELAESVPDTEPIPPAQNEAPSEAPAEDSDATAPAEESDAEERTSP